MNPWAEQLGQARIITAHRIATHEVLVLDDGSLRTFDGFGSVHRERSRCDTELEIVAATRLDEGYEVLTAERSIWRVTPSPCRKRRLRESGVPSGMRRFRVCGELLVAQHRDEKIRLWSPTGELLDEAPPPGRSAQHWFVWDRPCALCLNDTCYEPRDGKLVMEAEGTVDICYGPRESWPHQYPEPCLPGASSIPIGNSCRLLWRGANHAVSCFSPRVHGGDIRRSHPEGW